MENLTGMLLFNNTTNFYCMCKNYTCECTTTSVISGISSVSNVTSSTDSYTKRELVVSDCEDENSNIITSTATITNVCKLK